MKVMILGSSPLLIQKGLTESLAGRFELIPLYHWNYREMKETFGWNLDKFIYLGGYPGSAKLINDEERWASYIRDSLIETTISRDIFLLLELIAAFIPTIIQIRHFILLSNCLLSKIIRATS
ncbi:MAG: hypothetical protein QHH13_05395 [Melioribacter sp.]|uniref:hypothetical protein n=1 Tax=Rosettibacter primus TaxID=3111523 RepID=UPI00247DCF86|nr:hypothetical protein [Melioribacter sp.]